MTVFRRRRSLLSAGLVATGCALVIGAAAALAATSSPAARIGKSSASGSTASYVLPSSVPAMWPVLSKSLSSEEAEQMSVVESAVARLTKLANQAGGELTVNTALARRYYDADGRAAYLAPAAAGQVCNVEIDAAGPAGASCTSGSAAANGLLRWLIMPNGRYEITGVLPSGSSAVSITTAAGQVSTVPLNADDGFGSVNADRPTRVSYTLPNGVERVISELFPEPPQS